MCVFFYFAFVDVAASTAVVIIVVVCQLIQHSEMDSISNVIYEPHMKNFHFIY